MKRKTPGSVEKDRSIFAKVSKLGASPSSPSAPTRNPEQAQSLAAEAPMVLSS